MADTTTNTRVAQTPAAEDQTMDTRDTRNVTGAQPPSSRGTGGGSGDGGTLTGGSADIGVGVAGASEQGAPDAAAASSNQGGVGLTTIGGVDGGATDA